jgi:transaldolase/glucose-6-phosphate isomerase
LDLPYEGDGLIHELNVFTEQCRKDEIDKILLLGMGGSSLAPETMQLILGEKIDGLSLKILDSTIPEQVLEAEKWVDFKKTLFVVASKSGSTTESMEMFNYFWAKAEVVLGDERPSHFIAITDPGSSLMQLGESLGIRSVFTANPNVGGRYSALSHFGLVPAALMGIDLYQFLVPAKKMADVCAHSSGLEINMGALLGIIIGTGALNGKDKLTFLADRVLEPIGAWLEQLVAESSGKQGRGIVPIVDEPCLEAGDYHHDRVFIYLRYSGELDIFAKELLEAEHPVVTLDIQDLYELGAQFYLWEFAVAVACIVLEVNAFDQPNVQDSKDRTKQKIASFIEKGKLDEPELLWQKNQISVFGVSFEGLEKCSTINDVIDQFINLARSDDYIAINAYVPRNETTLKDLTHLRGYILQKTSLATTLGFGPRFLHSTGQLHKGGANNGLFLQITQDDEVDLDIPGKSFSFGILAKAQAQGDLDALLAKDRRVLRVHVKNPSQIAKFVA